MTIDHNTPQPKSDRIMARVNGEPVFSGANNATVATSASAGSADALPDAPAGYLELLVGGSLVKVALYAE